jgi:ATP-dependent helicase/nuclease subunit B
VLKGRIDRLDRGADDGYRLIDYKTGMVPTRQQVHRGEKIQLPFYALLLGDEKVAQALFLSIGDGEVTERNKLEGEILQTLKAAVKERILMLKQQLDEEYPLPAWGDLETCNLCDMEGLCRRGLWNEQIRVTAQAK